MKKPIKRRTKKPIETKQISLSEDQVFDALVEYCRSKRLVEGPPWRVTLGFPFGPKTSARLIFERDRE